MSAGELCIQFDTAHYDMALEKQGLGSDSVEYHCGLIPL